MGRLIGLMANWILKAANVYDFFKPGFRTELFLKIGLVLLGTTISFKVIVTAAGGAIIQGVIMVTAVYFFCWWLGGKFGLPDTLRAVMSTAVSICGVSAAIAAAGSVLAKKEEITYITALVIITALPLMVIAPLLAGAMNMPEPVAGAWFGGNVDTTAAVVGAGTIYGETAQTDRQHRQADPERPDRRGGLPAGPVFLHRGRRQEGTAQRLDHLAALPQVRPGLHCRLADVHLRLIPAVGKDAECWQGHRGHERLGVLPGLRLHGSGAVGRSSSRRWVGHRSSCT